METKRIIDILRNLRHRPLAEEEWRQLKEMAAHDPFLLDALEGLAMVDPDELRTRLQAIEQKLHSRSHGTKRRMFWYRSAAAIGLVLLAATAWLILGTSGSASIAMNGGQSEPAMMEAEDATPPSLSEIDTDSRGTRYALKTEQPASSPGAATSRVTDPDVTQFSPTPAEPVEQSESEMQPPSYAEEAVGSQREPVPPEPVQEQRAPLATAPVGIPDDAGPAVLDEPAASENTTVTRPQATISGRVLDGSGTPLPGANVILDNSGQGTVTDFDGRFLLAAPQDSNRLVISYTGLQSMDTTITPADNLRIVLEDSGTSLSGVEVTRSASAKRRAQQDVGGHVEGGRALAQPVGGERSYQKYIRQNLIYPRAAEQADIHGPVTLEFTLDSEGVPDEVKVLKSLGYGCDEEAIRLVREGPKWDVAAAQVPVGRYTIEF